VVRRRGGRGEGEEGEEKGGGALTGGRGVNVESGGNPLAGSLRCCLDALGLTRPECNLRPLVSEVRVHSAKVLGVDGNSLGPRPSGARHRLAGGRGEGQAGATYPYVTLTPPGLSAPHLAPARQVTVLPGNPKPGTRGNTATYHGHAKDRCESQRKGRGAASGVARGLYLGQPWPTPSVPLAYPG